MSQLDALVLIGNEQDWGWAPPSWPVSGPPESPMQMKTPWPWASSHALSHAFRMPALLVSSVHAFVKTSNGAPEQSPIGGSDAKQVWQLQMHVMLVPLRLSALL